jgi:hypothetical protein
MANTQDNNILQVFSFKWTNRAKLMYIAIFFLYVVTSSVGSRTDPELKNLIFLKLAETCFILISNSFECT